MFLKKAPLIVPWMKDYLYSPWRWVSQFSENSVAWVFFTTSYSMTVVAFLFIPSMRLYPALFCCPLHHIPSFHNSSTKLLVFSCCWLNAVFLEVPIICTCWLQLAVPIQSHTSKHLETLVCFQCDVTRLKFQTYNENLSKGLNNV